MIEGLGKYQANKMVDPAWILTMIGFAFENHQIGSFFGAWLWGLAHSAEGLR